MGVVDRVADVEEPPQQLAQLQRAAGRGRVFWPLSAWKRSAASLRLSPADEPHGVVGPAVGIGAQAVDRHDPRVLEAAGDLGLEQEAGAADRIIGVLVEDLLERRPRDAAPRPVPRRQHQAAPGVGAEDAESLPVGGRGADGEAGGAVGAAIGTEPT